MVKLTEVFDFTNDSHVDQALRQAGLPVSRCGLNADWIGRTWYLGKGRANHDPGGLYLTDDETNDDATWSVVRYWPEDDNGDDRREQVTEDGPVTLEQAIQIAKRELGK